MAEIKIRSEAEKEAEAKRKARRAFLDRRIPELHAQGKRKPPLDANGNPLPNMSSDYNGVLAREQADREWAALQAEER